MSMLIANLTINLFVLIAVLALLIPKIQKRARQMRIEADDQKQKAFAQIRENEEPAQPAEPGAQQ